MAKKKIYVSKLILNKSSCYERKKLNLLRERERGREGGDSFSVMGHVAPFVIISMLQSPHIIIFSRSGFISASCCHFFPDMYSPSFTYIESPISNCWKYY